MTQTALCLVAACCLLSPYATAQEPQKIVTFGGADQRQEWSVYYWDSTAKKLAGSYVFTYGAPPWKDEYDKYVATEQAVSIRLGKNNWASLDNSLPLTLGGVEIPVGQWYLGLRKEKGVFHLMVMSAKTLREKKIPAWMTANVRAKINAPLTYAKVEAKADDKADGPAENLTIQAKVDDKSAPEKATFSLRWGPHRLTAPIVASLPAKAVDAGAGKKGSKPVRKQKKANR